MTPDLYGLQSEIIRLRNRLGVCIHGDEKDCNITDEACGACLTGAIPIETFSKLCRNQLLAALHLIVEDHPDNRPGVHEKTEVVKLKADVRKLLRQSEDMFQ